MLICTTTNNQNVNQNIKTTTVYEFHPDDYILYSKHIKDVLISCILCFILGFLLCLFIQYGLYLKNIVFFNKNPMI